MKTGIIGASGYTGQELVSFAYSTPQDRAVHHYFKSTRRKVCLPSNSKGWKSGALPEIH
jgi:N-acetyl-gamma-glutamylphosphate reductase